MRHLLITIERFKKLASGSINRLGRAGGVLVIAGLLCGAPASAAEEIEFDISSQRADRAMTLFAQAANLPILFPNRDIRKIKTNPLRGRYTVDQGLAILLQGTGLEVSRGLSNQLIVRVELSAAGDRSMSEGKTVRKNALLSGVAAFFASLLSGTSGHAQEVPGEGTAAIEEVIVTARKREESVQDAPMSIVAFSSEALKARGLDDISQIGAAVPNMTFDFTAPIAAIGNVAAINIRGIGLSDWTLVSDPGVGLYVDGVYVSRSIGSIMDLVDIERVEVLRGPQGTLFGNNTIGGAVSIVSAKPVIGEQLANVRVTLGRYDRADFRGMVNVPLGETMAARLVLMSTNRDGYVKNLADGPDLGDDDSIGGRLALRWEPTSSLAFDLSADYARDRENPAPWVLLDVYEENVGSFVDIWNNNGIPGVTTVRLSGNAAVCGDRMNPARLTNPNCMNDQWVVGPYSTYSAHSSTNDAYTQQQFGDHARPDSEVETRGISLTAEWNLMDSLTIKSISAYRRVDDGYWSRDIDHAPFNMSATINDFEHEQWSEELQVLGTSMDGRLSWLVGAYTLHEKGCHLDGLDWFAGTEGNPIGTVITSGGCIDNSNIAFFGQATLDFTDHWSATFGLRYTDEDKAYLPRQFVNQDNVFGIPAGLVILPFEKGRVSTKEVTPYASVQFRWTEELMTYVSYSEGFRSGGFTQRVFPPLPDIPSFEPEYVKAYETGFKSTGLGGRVRFNGAAFFTDYTDLQVLVPAGLVIPGQVGQLTSNAASAEIWGGELDLTFVPGRNVLAELSVGYMDAELVEVDPAISTSFVSGAGALRVGNKLPDAPEWSLAGAIQYDLNTERFGILTPRIDWSYTSKLYNNAQNPESTAQEAVHLLSPSIRWTDPGQVWTVSLMIRNLTDEAVLVSGYEDPAVGIVEGAYAMPRTWALTIERDF